MSGGLIDVIFICDTPINSFGGGLSVVLPCTTLANIDSSVSLAVAVKDRYFVRGIFAVNAVRPRRELLVVNGSSEWAYTLNAISTTGFPGALGVLIGA